MKTPKAIRLKNKPPKVTGAGRCDAVVVPPWIGHTAAPPGLKGWGAWIVRSLTIAAGIGFNSPVFSQLTIQQQQAVTVPLNDSVTEGEGAGNVFLGEGSRILSIYHPSQFFRAMPEGAVISQIAFRLDESIQGSLKTFDLETEIRMSTTSSLATTIPPLEFSKNVGADETVVFPRGAVHWRSLPTASGPNRFDLVVPLKTPFTYDPRRGSLAIDFLTFQGLNARLVLDFAGLDDYGDTVISLAGNQLMDTSGGYADAPVLQLGYTTIPEPRHLTFFAFVLAGVQVFRKQNQRQKTPKNGVAATLDFYRDGLGPL